MPRYFFDIDNGRSVRDEAGMNLHDGSQVRHEALRRAAEFASDTSNLEEPGFVVVTVRDGQDKAVMRVRLACQIEVL